MTMNGVNVSTDQVDEDIISSDDDCETKIGDIDGDSNDALLALEDKNYTEALEAIERIQENVNNIHIYLTSKVGSNG